MNDDLDSAGPSSQYEALEDRALGKAQRGGRGGRRGGGGGGGGRGGQSREVQISKALSKLLRHQAESANIKLDGEGYAPLDRVLAWGPLKSLKVTLDEVKAAVTSSDKQRFSLKPKLSSSDDDTALALANSSTDAADYLIRANQGHSIKLESAAHLEAVTLEAGNVPERVLHGTYFFYWPRIVESGGLRPMGRNHVHCSTGTPEEGVVSGMRRDAELVVEVDVEASLRDGVKWWRSDNGVLLTEGLMEGDDGEGEQGKGGLGLKYFKRVTGRTRDVGVLWEDGEWKADLPAGLKVRAPHGKGGRGGRGGGGRGGRGRGG